MYCLFKKNVLGGDVSDIEMRTILKPLSKSTPSNIAKYVSDHPDFLKYKAYYKKDEKDTINFIKNNYINVKNSKALSNHVLHLKSDFKVQSIYYSNNDAYIIIVGKEQLFVIDSRSGKKVYQ
jgi:hypothetical protein